MCSGDTVAKRGEHHLWGSPRSTIRPPRARGREYGPYTSSSTGRRWLWWEPEVGHVKKVGVALVDPVPSGNHGGKSARHGVGSDLGKGAEERLRTRWQQGDVHRGQHEGGGGTRSLHPVADGAPNARGHPGQARLVLWWMGRLQRWWRVEVGDGGWEREISAVGRKPAGWHWRMV